MECARFLMSRFDQDHWPVRQIFSSGRRVSVTVDSAEHATMRQQQDCWNRRCTGRLHRTMNGGPDAFFWVSNGPRQNEKRSS